MRMQNKKMLLSLGLGIMTLSLLGAGCTQSNSTSDTTATTPVNDPMVVADAPAECPAKNTLVVTSDEAGIVAMEPANSYYIEWNEAEGNLVFANYDVNPNSIYGHTYAATDVLTVIKLSHDDKTAVGIGTYAKDTNQRASEFNISTIDLSGAVFNDTDNVEITYFGDNYVCGTVNAQDTYGSSILGDFIAQFHIQNS